MFRFRSRAASFSDPKGELWRAVFASLALVALYQIGLVVPAPGFTLPAGELAKLVDTYAVLEIHNHFIAGGGLYIGVGIFSLGFLPYIQAEALVAFLQVVVPRMRRLALEGQYGRRRIKRLTLLIAAALAFVNAAGFSWWIESVSPQVASDLIGRLLRIFILAGGSLLSLYLIRLLDEQTRDKGIPVLLTSNVMSGAVFGTLGGISGFGASVEAGARFAGTAVAVVFLLWAVTVLYQSQRRVPVVHPQSAASRKGRATPAFIPIALDYANGEDAVLASVCTALVALAVSAAAGSAPFVEHVRQTTDPFYLLVVAILLPVFSVTFAWTKFDTVRLADDLKKAGSLVPGIRPGETTVRYFEGVVVRVALVGAVVKLAIFGVVWAACALGLLSEQPVLLFSSLLVAVLLGGHLSDQIEASRLMWKYEGFLKKRKPLRP
jgi:preprotein translocase subunit SecY